MPSCTLALRGDRRLAKASSKSSALVPGYLEEYVKGDISATGSTMDVAQRKATLDKKAWEIVMSGGKQIPQQLFMMWMIGNSVHLMSMMMTGYMVFGNVSTMLRVNEVFKPFGKEDIDLSIYKAGYIAVTSIGVFMSVYKLRALGLLPGDIDYIAESPLLPAELSGGIIS